MTLQTGLPLAMKRQYSAYNMDQPLDKEERKREYNRLAQREFRRRRKEHLKNLEHAQKTQNTEQSDEIERLRSQNAELKRENEALKAQIYGSSSSSHLMSAAISPVPPQHDISRSYSVSPSINSTMDAMSNSGSPPATLASESMPMGSFSMTSSMLPPTMHAYSESTSMSNVPSQPYSMVQPSGLRYKSAQSSPESSGYGRPRPSVGSNFQPMSSVAHAPQTQTSEAKPSRISPPRPPSPPPQRSSMMVMAPYDRHKARADLVDIFAPLLGDPSIINSPSKHLNTLQYMSNSLPAVLRPTKTQLSTPHYYGIDMIASPSLRDRLLGVGSEVAKTFITECGNSGNESEDMGQILIWGDDPLDEMAWEFSQAILERWAWLLGREWIHRANFWRRQRGAPVLSEW